MLHVGFAETDITPKLGSQSPGGMQARRLNEVHDPLKAVAMVIQNRRRPRVALVGVDSIFISEEATAAARAGDHGRHQDSRLARLDRCQPHARRRACRDVLRVGGRSRNTSIWSSSESPKRSSRPITRFMPPSWAMASAMSRASASTAAS